MIVLSVTRGVYVLQQSINWSQPYTIKYRLRPIRCDLVTRYHIGLSALKCFVFSDQFPLSTRPPWYGTPMNQGVSVLAIQSVSENRDDTSVLMPKACLI